MGWAKYYEDNRIVVEERMDEISWLLSDAFPNSKDRVTMCTYAYPSNLSDYLACGTMTTVYGRK